jgi:phytanoyl-CoA dioxygenase PhyH
MLSQTRSKPHLQTISAQQPKDIDHALAQDGAVVVKDLFDTGTIAQISAGINQALEQVPWCNTADEGYGAEFFGQSTKRLHGVLQYCDLIEDCLMHPLTLATAERWLGAKPQFSTGEVMAIGPGERQQDLHTDAGSWHRAQLPGEILFSMTIALTDFTATNGATVVAPGSHKWPADYVHQPEDFIPAEMPQGCALFYTGNLLHSGGNNQTQTTRVGLYFGYIPFWLQPLENPAITHPLELLTHLNPATQEFLGYHPSGFKAILG